MRDIAKLRSITLGSVETARDISELCSKVMGNQGAVWPRSPVRPPPQNLPFDLAFVIEGDKYRLVCSSPVRGHAMLCFYLLLESFPESRSNRPNLHRRHHGLVRLHWVKKLL
jgi:hypothetical protein